LAGDAKTAARPATNSKASSKGDSAADTPDFRSAGESPGNTPAVPPPTPKLYGEDPSTGKPREVFGLQLGSEKEIREGLAPEGLAEEDVKDMAAAMTDGVALPAWTGLPVPLGIDGIRNRRITCVGCSGLLPRSEDQHRCIFAMTGFEQEGVTFQPCGTTYHLGCIVAGDPFRTRLPKDKGLSFPKVSIMPNFICEACTVRAMLGRELVRDPKDTALLMLERMRMIDQACAWDPKTLSGYQSQLRRIRQFEADYGIVGLTTTKLGKPPTSPAISLMWIQQHYALQTPRKTHATTGDRVSYGSARTIRSAASQFYTWDLQIAHPGKAMRDGQRRGHLTVARIPTDQLGCALMTAGMAK